jgi:hypothetical protein
MERKPLNIPISDPSRLYGRIFPEETRDKIFATASELFGYTSEQHDDFVGTEFWVMMTLKAIGEKMVGDAEAAERAGTGHHTAWGRWYDFTEMVGKGSYFPKPFVPEKKTEKPKAVAEPIDPALKLGTKLGEVVDLKPTAPPQPKKKRNKAPKPVEAAPVEALVPAAATGDPVAVVPPPIEVIMPATVTEEEPETETHQAVQAVG